MANETLWWCCWCERWFSDAGEREPIAGEREPIGERDANGRHSTNKHGMCAECGEQMKTEIMERAKVDLSTAHADHLESEPRRSECQDGAERRRQDRIEDRGDVRGDQDQWA